MTSPGGDEEKDTASGGEDEAEKAAPEGALPVSSGGEGGEEDWLDAEEAEEFDADAEEDFDADAMEEEWEHDLEGAWLAMDELGGEEDENDEWDEEDEEDLEEWADWMEAEADALSRSSQEPDMEVRAAEDLVGATAGRYFEGASAIYRIHTAHYHFQSADALALAPDFVHPLAAGAGGGAGATSPMLLATFDRHGVAAWLVPAAGSAQGPRLGLPQSAVRLGGFQHPADVFSMTCSPDGRYIVTGGESGILSIFTVDPLAPPRPMQRDFSFLPRGVTYFYTPIVAPGAHPAPPGPLQIFNGVQGGPGVGAGGGGAGPQPNPPAAPPSPPHRQRGQQGGAGPDAPGRAPGHAQQGAMQAGPASHATPAVAGARGTVEGAEGGEEEQQQLRHLELFQALMNQGPDSLAHPGPHQPDVVDQAHLMRVLRQVARTTDLLHSAERASQHHGQGQQQGQQQQQQQQQQEPRGEQQQGRWGEQQQQQEQSAAGSLRAVAGGRAQAPNSGGGGGQEAGPSAAVGRGPRGEQAPVDAAATPPAAAGGSAAAAAAGEAGGGQREREREQGVPAQPAAVMMACLVGLGLPEQTGPRLRPPGLPFSDDAMVNGVRFGLVGGKLRLVVAEQESKHVYVLEVPPSSTPRGLVHQHLLCNLGAPSPHWRMLPVSIFRGLEVPPGIEVQQELQRPSPRTAAIGPFPVPVNLALPSPDGRWMAVLGDSQAVFLVDQHDGFSWTSLPFDIRGRRDFVREDMSIGAQYCAWHPESTLLSVTSDGLHAVFVFDVASKQLVFRVEGHTRPCLGIMFAPWDPRLLLYNEETKHVFARDCSALPLPDRSAAEDFASAGSEDGLPLQLLRVTIVPPEQGPGGIMPFNSRRRRITGMAASRDGDLFVSTKQGAVVRYFGALRWSPARHRLWPPPFRQQARELLLCSHRRPGQGGEGGTAGGASGAVGLWALPREVVLHVLEALAGRRTDWLPAA